MTVDMRGVVMEMRASSFCVASNLACGVERKLGCFGVCRIGKNEGRRTHLQRTVPTRAHPLPCHALPPHRFPWMCPEQLQSHGIPTTKWDVFGFAIIAWELATRSKPWFGCTRRQVRTMVLAGQRLPIHPLWDPALRSLIADCWDTDPARRPEFSTSILMRLRAGGGLHMPS